MENWRIVDKLYSKNVVYDYAVSMKLVGYLNIFNNPICYIRSVDFSTIFFVKFWNDK